MTRAVRRQLRKGSGSGVPLRPRISAGFYISPRSLHRPPRYVGNLGDHYCMTNGLQLISRQWPEKPTKWNDHLLRLIKAIKVVWVFVCRLATIQRKRAGILYQQQAADAKVAHAALRRGSARGQLLCRQSAALAQIRRDQTTTNRSGTVSRRRLRRKESTGAVPVSVGPSDRQSSQLSLQLPPRSRAGGGRSPNMGRRYSQRTNTAAVINTAPVSAAAEAPRHPHCTADRSAQCTLVARGRAGTRDQPPAGDCSHA